MQNGWIKLHRQIMENDIYFQERFTRAQAWVDLLLLAGHKERTLHIRGIELYLKPGDLAYSQLTLAKRWRWNFKTVKKFLKQLEKLEMVECKYSNVTTIISIKNWGRYQTVESKTETKMESKTETNKKGKKGKEVALPPEFTIFIRELNDVIQKEQLPLNNTKSIRNRLIKPYSDYGIDALRACFDDGINKFLRNDHADGDVITYCLHILHSDYENYNITGS